MSLYKIYLTPQVYREIKVLPGHVRRKIKRAIADLANQPHPPQSKTLNFPGADREARRLELDKWRVVYSFRRRKCQLISLRFDRLAQNPPDAVAWNFDLEHR